MFSGIIEEVGLSTYGIFESMRVYRGKIFELDAHLNRFYEAARTLMLKIPYDNCQIKKWIFHTLKTGELKNAYLRISAQGESKKRAKMGITVRKVNLLPQDFYRKGVGIMSVAVRRDFINTLTPNIKSANFLSGVLAKIEANNQNAFEALILNHKGYVTEGTVSNIFIVKGKELLTPAISCGALGGITRKVVIDLARNFLGIKVSETLISRYDVYTAGEVFLTNTSIEIVPVICCDGRLIGNGKPGTITRRLMVSLKARSLKRGEIKDGEKGKESID